jgi:2-oxoglutarate dehydrogenase E2 component (dihydrolipoamide succinyltransferase)
MPDLVDVTLPADQAEGTENVVATWLKQVGDRVLENEPLLEISTDKVSVEIAAPASGVLREILKPAGERVERGEVLGRIEVESAAAAGTSEPGPPAAAAAGTPPTGGKAGASPPASELSPAVRRLLQEHRLDPSRITGTGRGGRITVEDVEAALAAAATRSRRVPHTPMRRSIAEHMVRSLATAPHVTTVFEADLSAVAAHREATGKAYTYTAYFVRATVEAIRTVPEANARWREDAIEIWEDCNIGIAVALGNQGLIVPVIRKAQELDLAATARAVADLTARARAGTLSPDEVQGGTFTISNHGVSGSLLAAPIVIHQPQSAILGVGKLQQRPVVRDGQVVIRPMLYVTLTIDHRVLDGYAANAFLDRWVAVIEGWR